MQALTLAALTTPLAFSQETPDRAQLEAELARTLSNCRMVGSFAEFGARQGTAPEPDSYLLGEVSKAEGDDWLFEWRIERDGRGISLPITVPILWAGDTPVISVTDLTVPLMGTFDARIVISEGHYAGTWSGEGHGGYMWGQVVPAGAADEPASPESGGAPGGGSDEAGTGVHWPQFRGPGGRGVADGYPTATEWDVEAARNVVWQTAIPGLSHASPVIWGDRLFAVTAARQGEAELKVGLYGSINPVPDEGVHEFQVYGLDKRSGRVLWTRTAHRGVPAVKRHPKSSHAASTPATDGRYVVAFFGSEGLYCFDVDGNPKWSKDLGILDAGYYLVPNAQWGFASSPVLHDGLVIVQCDVQGDSFVAAYRAETGTEVWRTDRDEVPSWGTPTVDVRPGRSQVIVNGYKHIGGYDLATGRELWWLEGGGDIPVPTPIVAHDLVFITNAHGRMAPILAIEADAEGELTMDSGHPHVRWNLDRRGNYMQTPIVYGEEIYFCNDAGVLTCYDARSGEEHYRERLSNEPGGFSGSGVVADGKLYFTSEEGEVHVVRAGREFEVLAVNDLGETCMSTPAVSEGRLYFRTRSRIVAIGQ